MLVKKFTLVTFFKLEKPLKYCHLNNDNGIGVEFDHRDSGKYLFNGCIEIYKVGRHLNMVIRKCTGELMGTLNYEYILINRDIKCVDLKNDNIIKSIYHLMDESYLIKIESQDFKVLRMELCPGDEVEFDSIIKDFDQGVI